MKDGFKKYVFEIIVIFIGITMSFFFDGWRTSREESQKITTQLIALNNDLDRIKSSISNADSNYVEILSLVSAFRSKEGLGEEEFVALLWKISEDPRDFSVQGLSPYLSQSSNSALLNYFFENDRIITLVSYINKLIAEEYEYSKSISDYTTQELWSKFDKSDLLDKVIKGDPVTRWADTTLVFSDKRYSINMFSELNADLYFVELKINRILQVHQALIRHLDRLKEELSVI